MAMDGIVFAMLPFEDELLIAVLESDHASRASMESCEDYSGSSRA
jgi:hypothetical protein